MPNIIILDLYESLNARAFDEKSSFYQAELNRAVERVKETLKALEKATKDKENRANYEKTTLHSHEALGILGERGTGKTSFILSLCRRLENEKELKNRLYFLPIIDPTLLENSERLLITVISNITNEVERKERFHRFSEEEEKYREAKNRLARALRVILRDSPHLKELATEPEIFAAEALKDAESGARLAQYFREFCAAALALLDKDFFVLPIDDIDMMLGQGYEVLETIRKYLSHDKILVILSGYFPLYRDITKGSFFNQLLGAEKDKLPEKVPEIFESDKKSLLERIEDLTIQYLLKIMPAYNRIEIRGINRKIWQKEIELTIQGRNNIEFKDLWKSFCEEFFFLPQNLEIDLFDPQKCPPAIMLPFSARGFINFAKILDEYYRDNGFSVSRIVDFWGQFLEIYISNFLRLNLEDLWNHLRRVPTSAHFGTLAALLFEHRKALGLNYWLLDPPGDPFSREGEDLRQIYLLIQLGINLLFRERSLSMVDFINWFSMAKEIIFQISPEYDLEKERRIKTILQYSNRIEDTLGHLLGLYLNEYRPLIGGALLLTKRRQRYGESQIMNTMVPYSYVVTWEDFYRKDYAFPFQKEVLEHIGVDPRNEVQHLESPDLFPAEENWEARADETARWLLYFFSTLYYPWKAEVKTYWTVSFFTALANLQSLLEKELPEDIEKLQKTLARDVPFYPMEGAAFEEEEGEKEEEEKEEETWLSPKEEWARVIREWWTWARKELEDRGWEILLPAPVLSRAVHRFYDNLRALSEELSPWERNLGFVVSRWILAFWQALLTEEYAFRSGQRENIQRIIRGDGIFAEEGKEKEKLNKFLSQARFSRIFIYCPILLGLVKENIRKRLLEYEGRPEFIKNFSFEVTYKLRDLSQKLRLSKGNFKKDPYTIFSALTVSLPPKAPKVTLKRDKFLEKLAENLAKVISSHAGA